jgi:hypothetical protein
MPVPPARSAIGRPALFMGIDNQDTLKKWVKVGFTQKGDRYLIDHGECLQREQLLIEADRPIFIGQEAPAPEVFEQGREQALATGRPWVDVMAEIHPGEWHVIEAGFYDEGFETNEVREFCLSTADASGVPRFFPVKGSATSHMGGSADIVVEKNNRFFVGTTPITVYHINDSDLKHELYTACIGDFERIRRGRSKHPRLWFPAYLEEEFTKELLTEKRGQMMRRGRMEWMWLPLKSSEKNDFADALKYTFALWHVVKRDYGWVDLTPVMDAVGKIIHVREGETAPTNPLVRGRDYLFNVGGDIDTGAFDEDHAPIGPQLRVQLVRYGVAEERDGRIYLNPKALPLEILLGETAGEAAEPSGAPAA